MKTKIKLPPSNIEIEQAVLGAMLINFKCIFQVKQILSPTDFYKEAHNHICAGIFSLKDKVDALALSNHLESKEVLEKSGGLDYIAQLIEDVVTSAGVINHCNILKELSERRQLIQACQDTSEAAYHPNIELERILSDHKTEVRSIKSDTKVNYEEGSALIGQVFDDIQAKSKSGVHQVGVLIRFL